MQISLCYGNHISFAIYSEVELLDHIVILFLIFQEMPHSFLPHLSQSISLPIVHKSSIFSTFISYLSDHSQPERCDMISHHYFDCIFLLINDVEHIFMYLLTIQITSSKKYLFRFFIYSNFFFNLFNLLLLSCFSHVRLCATP